MFASVATGCKRTLAKPRRACLRSRRSSTTRGRSLVAGAGISRVDAGGGLTQGTVNGSGEFVAFGAAA